MQGTSECTVERPSQEFAYAMIARIALTAGGYTLRPDTSNPSSYGSMQRPSDYQKYYQIARTAAKKVIDSGTHQLNKSYRQVFIDECNYIINNADDPIFELISSLVTLVTTRVLRSLLTRMPLQVSTFGVLLAETPV